VGLVAWKGCQAAQCGGLEVEQDLAADGLHPLPGDMHRDLAAVGNDAQFGKRLLDRKFAPQRCQGAADLLGLDAALAQLDDGLDGDQVGKRILVGVRNQFLALPASQLALGKSELAQHIGPRVLLFRRLRQHATILTGSFSRRRGAYGTYTYGTRTTE